MDKRVLMASVISMGVVLVWIAFFGKPKHDDKTHAAPTTAVATAPATANPATAQAAADAAKKPEPAEHPDAAKHTDAAKSEKADAAKSEKAEGPPAPPAEKPAAVESTLELPKHYHATFTSEGAAPTHWVLLDPQYKEDNPRESNKQAEPIDLVKTKVPNLPLEVSFPSSSFKLPPDAVWKVEQTSDGSLVYTWEDDTTKVTKRFQAKPNSYEVPLTVTVENKSDKPEAHFFRIEMHGWHDPSVKQGGMFSRRVSQTQVACYVGGKAQRTQLDELLKKGGIEARGDVRWVGIGEQYFFEGVALAQSQEEKVCNLAGAADGSMSSILTVGSRTVPAHGKTEYQLVAFMGPKILAQLDAVQVGGQTAHMGDVLEFRMWGLTEWLERPMLAVLKAIHFVLPNWGVAIIILTIILKAVTWFPTQKSMKSMKAMAKLKPEMDKIKARFGDDKNALNLATMELYKKHGVNPLGGCLPILIQMPIYIALYSMLGNSVELYRSPFVWWIRDLTAADPYFVLPIVTGLLMFLQQLTQPTTPDAQQKMMMYLTPVMYTAFSIFLPAGLTIYILTNTLLTFVQQWLMNRGEKPTRPKAAATTKPARA
jgi:YidC/Oxa1 family membrane protein insertase